MRITAQGPIRKEDGLETGEIPIGRGLMLPGDSKPDPTGTGANETLDLVQVSELVSEKLVRRCLQ